MHIQLSRPAGGRVGTWIPFSPFRFFVALRGYLSIDSMGMGMAFALPHHASRIVHRIPSLRLLARSLFATHTTSHHTPARGGQGRRKGRVQQAQSAPDSWSCSCSWLATCRLLGFCGRKQASYLTSSRLNTPRAPSHPIFPFPLTLLPVYPPTCLSTWTLSSFPAMDTPLSSSLTRSTMVSLPPLLLALQWAVDFIRPPH